MVEVIRIRPADRDHQVVTLSGGDGKSYRRKPCAHCPWRLDQPTGRFPPEAFRHSAETAHDLSDHRFGCHMSGVERAETCAGFLLRGAAHNLAVRLDLMTGRVDLDDVSTDVPLYNSYRDMAQANGVAAEDPALLRCRDPE